MSGAVLSDANLAGARFVNVDMRGVSIEDANIEGLSILGHDIAALIAAEVARGRTG